MVKRRRSELNESEGEVSPSVSASQAKRQREDRWSLPEELRCSMQTEICQKLYDFLRKYKDSSNHVLCEFLIRVPSRRSLPSYYEVVQTPIDLIKIQQKLKVDEYRTVQQFLSDIQLLLNNAKLFYGVGSEEHGCVCALEDAFVEKLQQIGGSVAGRDTAATSDLPSPPSLTLRISKDHIRTPPSKTGPSSSKLGPKTLTRLRAWLAEYRGSGDPLKMMMAGVYDHRDGAGTLVAEAFYELPSAKDYPEYYRVITEPIDLNVIKKNLEEGRYSNLRELQGDMVLMVKNAHHFNEPGSDIYKMASSLRKFIVSHCAELERKFQTIPKSLKVSLKRPSTSGEAVEEGKGGGGEGRGGGEEEEEEEEKKVPKLRMRVSSVGGEVGGVKVGKKWSRISKTPEANSDSDSMEEVSLSEGEREEEEMEEEEEEEGEERGKGKGEEGKSAAKNVKVAADQRERDYVAKLVKARNPPSLKKQLMCIYNHLTTHRDRKGRQCSELFMKKPSAKAYPEYFLVIRKPIDFQEILHKIKQEQYPSLDAMIGDVELLVSNAVTFNEEESTVYQDALTLQRLAHDAVHQLTSAWDRPPKARGRPRKSASTPDGGVVSAKEPPSLLTQLYTTIKAFTLQGRPLWKTFMVKSAAIVSGDVKKINDFSSIAVKYSNNTYSTVHQLYEDLHVFFDHIIHTHQRDSLLHKDALALCRAAAKKYLELTAEERRDSHYPDVQAEVRKLLKDIFTKTLHNQDTQTGPSPADSLRDVTLTQEIPGDGDDPPISRTLSLSSLEAAVDRGQYCRLESLQNNLFTVLRHAREGSTKGGQVWRDSVAVQKAFISCRDEVCGRGDILWSPALSYSERDLEQELATISRPAEGHKSPQESEATPQAEKTNSKEYFDRVTIDNATYRVGDIVYITARIAGQKPHVVLIERLWKDSADIFWLDGTWFYRPEETFHLATRKFYEKEVFKSDFHSVAKLSDVRGKCCVLVLKDYMRYVPQGLQAEDVYVCESRYTHKAKNFKRIKNWNYPPSSLPELIPRDIPILLSRVPSVFMTQSTRAQSGSHTTLCESDLEAVSEVPVRDPELPTERLEDSIFEPLENIRATAVSGATPGCVYFEQYCIDEDKFRLGDCVYVRSDQDKPFIARVDKMWTDSNGDPWFHGPWFVYPEEVVHHPTRLFLHHELFMSSIHDTNPMRSIIGRCVVLYLTDYCRKRPTEFAECDVFVVESRYQEKEGEIRKLPKALKQFQLSKGVQLDELYFFQREIQPIKLPSQKLLMYSLPPPSPLSPPPSSLPPPSFSLPTKLHPLNPSQTSSGQSTPTIPKPSPQPPAVALPSSTSGAPSTPPGVPVVASGGGGSMLSINPQLLQALLASASQGHAPKPIIIPVQQQQPGVRPVPAVPTMKPPPPPPTPPASSTPHLETKPVPVIITCEWDGCGKKFNSLNDLTTHLLLNNVTSHVIREGDGNYYCRWATCPRNPRHGGRAFDVMPKITRHVKEVHLLKFSQTALGLNPRSHVIQGQTVRPSAAPTTSHTPSHIPPATPTTTFQLSLPSSLPTLPSLPSALSPLPSFLPVANVPSVTSPTTQTAAPPTANHPLTTRVLPVPPPAGPPPPPPHSSQPQATSQPKQTGVSSLFISPSENKKPLLHSAIYTKYIQNLQRNSSHMTSLVTSDQIAPEYRPVTQPSVKASDWLDPAAVAQHPSVADALLLLRDHLLKDSFRLDRHTSNF